MRLLCVEEVDQTHYEDHCHDDGQDVGHVGTHPFGYLQTGAFIGFAHEFFPAPAVAGGAEDDENQRTYGQQDIADDEVFAVQDIPAGNGTEAAPEVVAQQAGEAQQENGNAANDAGLPALPACQLGDAGYDILEHGQYYFSPPF